MKKLLMVTYYTLDNYKTQYKYFTCIKNTVKFCKKLSEEHLYATLWELNENLEWVVVKNEKKEGN